MWTEWSIDLVLHALLEMWDRIWDGFLCFEIDSLFDLRHCSHAGQNEFESCRNSRRIGVAFEARLQAGLDWTRPTSGFSWSKTAVTSQEAPPSPSFQNVSPQGLMPAKPISASTSRGSLDCCRNFLQVRNWTSIPSASCVTQTTPKTCEKGKRHDVYLLPSHPQCRTRFTRTLPPDPDPGRLVSGTAPAATSTEISLTIAAQNDHHPTPTLPTRSHVLTPTSNYNCLQFFVQNTHSGH